MCVCVCVCVFVCVCLGSLAAVADCLVLLPSFWIFCQDLYWLIRTSFFSTTRVYVFFCSIFKGLLVDWVWFLIRLGGGPEDHVHPRGRYKDSGWVSSTFAFYFHFFSFQNNIMSASNQHTTMHFKYQGASQCSSLSTSSWTIAKRWKSWVCLSI